MDGVQTLLLTPQKERIFSSLLERAEIQGEILPATSCETHRIHVHTLSSRPSYDQSTLLLDVGRVS